MTLEINKEEAASIVATAIIILGLIGIGIERIFTVFIKKRREKRDSGEHATPPPPQNGELKKLIESILSSFSGTQEWRDEMTAGFTTISERTAVLVTVMQELEKESRAEFRALRHSIANLHQLALGIHNAIDDRLRVFDGIAFKFPELAAQIDEIHREVIK